jgi:hypothetical protein
MEFDENSSSARRNDSESAHNEISDAPKDPSSTNTSQEVYLRSSNSKNKMATPSTSQQFHRKSMIPSTSQQLAPQSMMPSVSQQMAPQMMMPSLSRQFSRQKTPSESNLNSSVTHGSGIIYRPTDNNDTERRVSVLEDLKFSKERKKADSFLNGSKSTLNSNLHVPDSPQSPVGLEGGLLPETTTNSAGIQAIAYGSGLYSATDLAMRSNTSTNGIVIAMPSPIHETFTVTPKTL